MTVKGSINADVKTDQRDDVNPPDDSSSRQSSRLSDVEVPENVTELVDDAIRAYEFRVKYYEELIRETVNEFEGGLKRAHVDELSVLINEASDETKQMQHICQKIVNSLGRLIPVIYQSIEILEFQVKSDTEHLLAMEHNWSGTDAIGGDESEKEEAKTDSELNEETKEGLGNVKLIRSIDKIEKQIIKGPVPAKVQVAMDKARKLGRALVGFLNESKNVRSVFKEAQGEADSAAVINFLAQASARTTGDSQNLALYYGKQGAEEVKEMEIQTSRQVTRLKTELMQRTTHTLTSASRVSSASATAQQNQQHKGEEVDGVKSEADDKTEETKMEPSDEKKDDENNKELDKKENTDAAKEPDERAGESQETSKAKQKSGKKGKAAAAAKGKKGKGAAKEKGGNKAKKTAEPPLQTEKSEAKEKEETEKPKEDNEETPAAEPEETDEERAQREEEEQKAEQLAKFAQLVDSKRQVHQGIGEELAQFHVRARQVQDEMKAAERVFTKFDTKYRYNLEELMYFTMDKVFTHLEKVEPLYMMATSSSGVLMENVEEAQQGKQDLMMQEMLTNQIADSEQQALEDLQALRDGMDLMERVYESFRDTKCIWEVEIPTAVLSEARERLTALRDLNYRVQFNRKELVKISTALLKELNGHEWRDLIEIQLLGVPGQEVERIVALIEKQTISNESFALKTVADIDRMTRSVGMQKVAPLEDVYRAIPELEYRFSQLRVLLNNIQKLMVESRQNVNKLMEDPSKKWNLVPILRCAAAPSGENESPIGVFRVPEECVGLAKSMDVRTKHAWEKSAVRMNELLVSEVVYFQKPPELPCHILLGISHGVPSVNDSCERLIIKQTFDGVDWMEVEPYKSHLFYSYPDNKTTFPPAMVFGEVKTDQLALAYCVVVEYKDGRVMKKAAPQVYTESKKIFREGGRLFAAQNKQSQLVVPRDSFQYLSSVSVKSISAGYMIEEELLKCFTGLNAVSALFSVEVEATIVSQLTTFSLSLPYPQQVEDVRRPTSAKLTVIAFEKTVQQWVLMTNSGTSSDVISVQGGTVHINFPPANIGKLLVVNGSCDHIHDVPEQMEYLLAKVPRKPYCDDDILDDNCLRQIVDKITLEFDRFAIVLGISTAYRNKARVNSKANIMQQKFEILREWKRKNIDSGDLCVKMLKSLRSEIVGRYDIADWLEELIVRERNIYWENRSKYQSVQPATHRRDYIFSPATIGNEDPFLGQILEEPTEGKKPNSRGLSDMSFRDEVEPGVKDEDPGMMSDRTELTDYGSVGDLENEDGNNSVTNEGSKDESAANEVEQKLKNGENEVWQKIEMDLSGATDGENQIDSKGENESEQVASALENTSTKMQESVSTSGNKHESFEVKDGSDDGDNEKSKEEKTIENEFKSDVNLPRENDEKQNESLKSDNNDAELGDKNNEASRTEKITSRERRNSEKLDLKRFKTELLKKDEKEGNVDKSEALFRSKTF